MDQTNYPLLSIVSLVAIVAVVAMFLNAKAPDGIASLDRGAALASGSVFSVPITGAVVAVPAETSTYSGNPLDLDDDGRLDPDDADILGDVIDRVQFCPRNKRCDLTDDGVIDLADLGELNAQILRSAPRTPQPTSAPAAPAPVLITGYAVNGNTIGSTLGGSA